MWDFRINDVTNKVKIGCNFQIYELFKSGLF